MPDRPPAPKTLSRRFPPMLVACAVIALVAFFFLARKVGAQPTKPPPTIASPTKLAPIAAAPISTASVAPAVSAVAKDDKPAEKKDAYEEPVDYAVAGPDGGVPLHPDGEFRSPFAHPHFGGAANVRVGILLANVREYDIQKGSFEADFFLTYTSDKPMPPVDPIFTNGKVDLSEKMADTPTFKMYRFVGTFSSPPDLRSYPFDTQELTMEIEDDDNGTDQMKLVPDQEHTNLDVGFEVPGWETSFTKVRVLNHYFPDRFDNDDMYYSRFIMSVGIRRYGTSAVFTVFVPAIVIVLISMSGLWLPLGQLEVRSNATTPMLAAAVLFHFALMQQLPATAYLTRADKLMMSVYAILFFHMLIAWLWFAMSDKHESRIFAFGKWFGAPATVAILAVGCFV